MAFGKRMMRKPTKCLIAAVMSLARKLKILNEFIYRPRSQEEEIAFLIFFVYVEGRLHGGPM